MKIAVERKDGWITVLLLPYKDESGWSIINLTEEYIYPGIFPTLDNAIANLENQPDVIDWEP